MLTLGVNISSENITTMLGYVSDVFNDLKLVIFIILAVGIGLWIVEALISALRPK